MCFHIRLDFVFHNNPDKYSKQIWTLGYCVSLGDDGDDDDTKQRHVLELNV